MKTNKTCKAIMRRGSGAPQYFDVSLNDELSDIVLEMTPIKTSASGAKVGTQVKLYMLRNEAAALADMLRSALDRRLE